jgi:hypothetical protein
MEWKLRGVMEVLKALSFMGLSEQGHMNSTILPGKNNCALYR